MSPQQALQIVDQVCAAFHTSRAEHVQIMNALQVLRDAIEPPKAETLRPPKIPAVVKDDDRTPSE